jgi:sugar/nucleoside kinase (ribokinase family)
MMHTHLPTVAVLGGASWNQIVKVTDLPLNDVSTRFATGCFETVGGTGAGKALNLARLGLPTRLHALLGADEAGEHVRAALAEAGVEFVTWTDPRGTERHLNLMDDAGRRLSIYLEAGSPDPGVTAADLLAVTDGASVVFVNLAAYTRRCLGPLTDRGVSLWIDLHDWDGDSDFHQDFIEHAQYLFLSDVRLDDALVRARHLAESRRLVVVTHGEHGATAFLPGHDPLVVPATTVSEVVDTNGAGDAFSAGVAYGYLRGWDWPAALRAGSWLAARCVAAEGLVAPGLTPGDLERNVSPSEIP